ncbi:hypothetical protein B0J12DRAFT_118354 [Macrophomina phaseolina]|uniref:Uncharacterized protein n=1 Tax=Macrophomina phaseolina TaxID=35725 RepID=A0ABQ8GAD5_9PEZI|nr:hypothetical protein B0J12DRAFT_118354 [Macrophomina phaseolina]
MDSSAPVKPTGATPSVRSSPSTKAASGMASLFSCFGPRKPAAGTDGDASNSHALSEKSAGTNNSSPRAWEAQLPKPVDDYIIREKVTGIFDSIDTFVDKYYRDKTSLELDSTHEACLMLVTTPHLPSSLIDLVQSNRPNPLVCRPTTLIKHSIAYLIQQAMTMDEGGRNSLLPPLATALPQALRGQDHADKAAFDEAFTHWRVLTAYLQPSTTSGAAKQSRTQAVRAMADRIFGAFAPWEKMPGAPEQRADLVAICDAAAEAATIIFAQPANFAYVWEPENLNEEEDRRKIVVVKPGLVKMPVGKADAAKEPVVAPTHVPLTFPDGFVAS